MGRGLTQEEEYAAKRSGVRSMAKQLQKAGVAVTVKGLTATGGSGDASFTVGYGTTLRASNGECFGNPNITIKHPAVGEEVFTLLDAQTGLNRIMALFGDEAHRATFKQTCLEALKVQIEGEVRKADQRRHLLQPGGWYKDGNTKAGVFLHDASGQKVAQNKGEIYFYTEYRNGKVYVRLGTSGWHVNQDVSETDYVEFAPGMTVRDETGKVLVEYPKAAI